jgi:uncharacterized protein
LMVLKDVEAVKRSIRNLILTNKFERPYQPLIGGNVTSMLFELFDELAAHDMEKAIRQTIANYEPRAEVLDVKVTEDAQQNGINITLRFRVVNQTDPTEVEFFVERIR